MACGCNQGGCVQPRRGQGCGCRPQDPCKSALHNIKKDVAGIEDAIDQAEKYLCDLKKNLVAAEENCAFDEEDDCDFGGCRCRCGCGCGCGCPRPCPRPCPGPCPRPCPRPCHKPCIQPRTGGCGCR